eukprot:876789_1
MQPPEFSRRYVTQTEREKLKNQGVSEASILQKNIRTNSNLIAVISEQRTQPLRGVDNQNITPRNRNKLTKKRIKRAKNNPNNPYFKQKAWLSRNRNLEYFRETDNCVNKPKGKRKKRKTKDKDIYDW